MGANQKARKLLSNDLANTNKILIYYSKNGYFPFLLPVDSNNVRKEYCKNMTKAAGFAVTHQLIT